MMEVSEPLEFGHKDRKDIYEFVERHGTVPKEKAYEELFSREERRFRHQLALLKRDGYIEENDGVLRVSFEPHGKKEDFEEGEIRFTIRPARQEDLGGVISAIREVVEEKRHIVAESVAEQIDHQDVLLRHNEIGSRVFFVALVGDDVVGWAHIEAEQMDKLSHTAEVTFGVIEEYRGNGVGKRLFERTLEWSSSKGYEKLYQSVPATNEEAIEFLERNGCEVEARRKRHYKIGGEYVDEVMLAIYL
jgi:ribosomal protein S18 acetylase RimI-like enzyme